MKTKRTEVVQKMAIWAIPKSDYEIEESPNEMPFNYKIMTGPCSTPWQDGSVKVHEADMTMYVPAGLDLLEKAVETLKDQIKETRAEAQSKIVKYEAQINNLLLIEWDGNIKDDMTGLDPSEIGVVG